MFQVAQLIIIGGPSCAGKSFLIEKIQQGDYPLLRKQLGIDIPSSWLYVSAGKLKHIRQPIIERLVVHYDIYARYSQENGFNHLHELITNSDRTTILTLCVPQKILIKRNNSRLLKSLFDLVMCRRKKRRIIVLRRINRQWEKRKSYERGFSEFLYERWFNYFIQSSGTSHWLLDFNQSNILIAYPFKPDKVGIFTKIKKVVDRSFEQSQSQSILIDSESPPF